MTLNPNKKIIRSLFSYTTATVIAQSLIAVYTLVLIWWLDTEAYGYITANYATVLLTSFVINLGLHEWLIRSIQLNENPKALTGFVMMYKLIAGVLWTIGLLLVLPLIKPEIYTRSLLLIIILDVWLESYFNLFLVDLLGHKRVAATSILLIASKSLRLCSIIIVILLGSKSLIHITLFRVIGTFIVFCIALFVSKPTISRMKKPRILEILRNSFIFNTAETQNLIFQQLDLNLLTFINGNPALIGDYSVVISLFNMIMTIPLGLASLILPHSIEARKTSSSSFKKKMTYIFIGFLILGVLICGSLRLLKLDLIYNRLSDNYQSIITIILLASPIILFKTVNQSNKVYLLSVEWEKKQLLPQLLAIISKIVLGVVLITNYELKGMIWVSIISEAVLFFGFMWQVIRHQLKRETKPFV